ncbi:TOMM precursor leader peptide-binding protein [Micromonospora sp. NPDC047074]|uniref:TOMM precursor leader peptide-binding protein n=1 Tax=Micromonospora sp. NPDC047074 TaxID=3154339 RepID=UPI0033C0FF77
MRPKLRNDLMYVPDEDGVYLETGRGNARLTGPAAHALIRRIAPHLDGRRTVDALTGGLPAEQRRLVTEVVDLLVERGVARDLDREPPHGLRDWELERYHQQILFAEHVADAPLHRFEQFRNSRVLLIGAGEVLASLVQTLFELGLGSISVLATGEDSEVGPRLRRVLDDFRTGDPELRLTIGTAAGKLDDETGLAQTLAGYDAVLHCADHTVLDRALRIDRVARSTGARVLHAFPLDGEAWVGPSGHGQAGACLACVARSASDRNGLGTAPCPATTDSVGQAEPLISAPMGAVTGAVLAFAYFRYAVGAESAMTARMSFVDLSSGTIGGHLAVGYPGCVDCGPRPAPEFRLADQVAEMAGRTPVDLPTFVSRIVSVVDPRLGLIRSVGTGAHSQLLVSCVEAVVVDPDGGVGTVRAVGGTREQALNRVGTAAFEYVGARLARRGRPAITAGRTGEPERWWDPVSSEEVLATPDAVTVTAGFSWSEALGRAVLHLRRAEAVAPPAGGPGSPADPAADIPDGAWIDPADWPEPSTVLAGDAAVLGHPLYAWRDSAPTPTVFVGTGTRWLAHCCDLDVATALEHGVQAAVAVLTDRGDTRADAGTDSATEAWAGAGVGPGIGVDGWESRLEPLLTELAAAGRRLLVRPVDDVPGSRAVLPFLVEATVVPTGGAR